MQFPYALCFSTCVTIADPQELDGVTATLRHAHRRIPFLEDRNQNEGAGPFGILCEGRRRDKVDGHMQSSHSGLEYYTAGVAQWLSL